MILTLLILTLIIGGYSLHILNKKITKNKLYLLDEIDNKSSSNLDYLYKEIEKIKKEKQDEFKFYIEDLVKTKYYKNQNLVTKKFDEINRNIDIKHQQLISGEIKKLRSKLNKDLNIIVKSVKNIKIF